MSVVAVISQHLLNVFVQLANKMGFKTKQKVWAWRILPAKLGKRQCSHSLLGFVLPRQDTYHNKHVFFAKDQYFNPASKIFISFDAVYVLKTLRTPRYVSKM
jgi:hypothetical protein